MKHFYGLLVLIISTLLSFFLIGQIYLNEANSIIKYLIILLIFLLIIIIDLRSLMTLTKKIKKGLPDEKRVSALKRLKKKKRMTSILLTLLSCLLVFSNYIYYIANKTISSVTLTLEPTEFESYMIVLKDSPIQDIYDSSLTYIGFDHTQSHSQSLFEDVLIENYDKYAYVDYQPFFYNLNELKEKLNNNEIHALYLSEESLNQLSQSDPNFTDSIRVLSKHTIYTSYKAKPVKVNKEAFNVLILGVDIRESEGDIHTNTRADTIMIASFNPNTMKAQLLSIPRDSLVPLSYNNQNDKLTHASLYGVDCMIETVEDLLDININYYAKFNFKALVGLVDALGGIDVDVKFSFSESNSDDIPNTIHVSQGYQTLNGEQALAYARHRSTQNDHVRNNSQQEVLKAILSKIASFDSVTKINDLLNVLNTNMSTNYGRKEILSTLTLLPKLTDLQINSAIIEGEDVLTYVPKYDEDLWITLLDEQSIELNKNAIQDILKGVE